jgi:RimJ/RimL family protein N-acetyltransferase
MRFIGPWALPDAEAYRRRIREVYLPLYARRDGTGFWAVVEKGSGEFLGWIYLRAGLEYRFAAQADFGAEDLELGYRFRRVAWGKGYATEAARALVERAADLGARRIVSSALIGNRASIRVMEKAGLKYDGEFDLPNYDEPSVRYALDLAAAEPQRGDSQSHEK